MTALAPFHTLRRLFQPRSAHSALADRQIVEQVRDAAAAMGPLSDDALRAHAEQLRMRVRGGRRCLESAVVVPAFALVHEATRRMQGIELFDVQLLAGLTLARGAIAEMATGEGKTLAAALPAFLQSLSGQGVHIATPNAYLADRDFNQVGPIFALLGVSAGLVPESEPAGQKRAAYACDITYATGYELGFDYLRDRLQIMGTPRRELGQRQVELLRGETPQVVPPIQPRRACVIIDEIDSVLIDEACLPLVVSAGANTQSSLAATYAEATRVCGSLRPDEDYLVDTAAKRVTLTSHCLQKIYGDYARRLQLDLERPWAKYVEQAVAAKVLHKRDIDYIVRDGKVLLVDEFTGRIFPDRSWREGLHQAVEAKEGLLPTGELRTAARVSRQRYFRLYRVICGMTGTAAGNEREFQNLYRLKVAAIPLRKRCRREVLPTRFFLDAESKWRAIVKEVAEIHETGRPVLIGSRTIENSELLAQRLEAAGVPFHLLNGKQDRQEAEIVAMAGHRGTVTIATNMAGRGTDIRLGPGVVELGGMHVVGVECHESQRIDRQLVGRSARQGDPGSGRFFVSADDALICRFGPRLRHRMQHMPHDYAELREDLTREVAAVQRAAEVAARVQRRQMLVLDDWLDNILAAMGDRG
ncbi:MAG: preprotein translocase subunit SecA [Pirellulales bacterium]